MWKIFLSACALVLVIEGMLPFLNPELWRATMLKIVYLPGKTLRTFGFMSMFLGVLLLYLVNHYVH